MAAPSSSDTISPFVQWNPRKKLGADDIQALIEDMKAALQGAQALGYFERMERNHNTRFAWWEGQSDDGKKWGDSDGRRLKPGEVPRDVFPWEGSSDVRIRQVEKVIREHNVLKRLAVQRRQQVVGPRNLSPDEDPQAKSALWGQVAAYYEDLTKREVRRAFAQWADIAHEYGHGILFAGWKSETKLAPRKISAEQLQEIVVEAALASATAAMQEQWAAEGGAPEEAPDLTPEEQVIIEHNAAAKLADMVLDPKQRELLVAELLKADKGMPRDEALRVASKLKLGADVDYYAVEVVSLGPDLRALTYGIDAFFPPLQTRLQADLPWFAMPEWVSVAELKNRVNDPHTPYQETWVEEVIKHKGKAFNLSETLRGCSSASWILSGGSVRSGLSEAALDSARQQMVQILHVYYQATTAGNVKALHHVVLSGHVLDKAGHQACCEHAHGRYPFFEHLTDLEAPYILASEGYAEKSFTDQNEVKAQRDSRVDNASMKIKPPLQVPMNKAGTSIPLRPGIQIPMRTTAGMGTIAPIYTGADSRDSVEVERATLESFNEFWNRGPNADPVMKQAYNQVLVSDFLMDVCAVKECVFQLIQQFAPQELRASFVGGLPVNLSVSNKEIQGQVAIDLDFDVTELDPAVVEKRMKNVPMILSVDTANELNRGPLLRALVSAYLPAHFKGLVADPNKRADEETKDEQDILGTIIAGTQFDEGGSYQEGINHALRLQVMQRVFGAQTDSKGVVVAMQPNGAGGQPSRAQRIYTEDPDVKLRVDNRFAFHARQLQQQKNAQTGRELVEPVVEQ